MRVSIDVKALEWAAGTFLSQDQVALQEIWNQEDIHTNNQKAFNLPDRLTAKTFVFRLVYGGSAFAYASDPAFSHVSKKKDYWQGVIDAFYAKYQGWSKWHSGLMNTVIRTGKIVMPTGREYSYSRVQNFRGEWEWPRTTILNYPVQGLGADLVMLYRIKLYRVLTELYSRDILLFISTIHDSIELDCASHIAEDVKRIAIEVAEGMPAIFSKQYNINYNLPFVVEVEFL